MNVYCSSPFMNVDPAQAPDETDRDCSDSTETSGIAWEMKMRLNAVNHL